MYQADRIQQLRVLIEHVWGKETCRGWRRSMLYWKFWTPSAPRHISQDSLAAEYCERGERRAVWQVIEIPCGRG